MRRWRLIGFVGLLILGAGHGALEAEQPMKQQRPELQRSAPISKEPVAPIRVEAAGLALGSEQVRLGQGVKVKVTIKNAGHGTVQYVPWVLRNVTEDALVGKGEVGSLEPGQSAERVVEFRPGRAGVLKLRLQVERKGNTATATVRELDVTVLPAATAQGPVRLEFSRTETGGGLAVTATVVLQAAAPAAGVLAALSSPDSGVTFPAQVMVAAGRTRQDFSVQVASVTAPKTVSITVAALGATDTKSLRITTQGAPTIAGFTPTSGPFGQQTEITITGTNLDQVTSVNVGTNPSATILAQTPTSLRVRKPTTTGSAYVGLWYRSANDGSTQIVRSTGLFQVIMPLPVIASVRQPSPGQLIIEGDYLYYATKVEIGTREGQIFGRNPSTVSGGSGARDILTIIPPSGLTAGQAYDIKVTNTGGTTTSPAAWTLQAPPAPAANRPTIAGFTPTSGPFGQQTEITITGTNLDQVTSVNVGTNPSATILAQTPTSLRVRKPTTTGSAYVGLWYRSANDGSTQIVRSTGLFQVIMPLPVIASVRQPSPGQLIIEGDYLYYATKVEIGTREGQIFGRNPSTVSGGSGARDILTIIPPSGLTVGQPYDIKVTNTGGTTTSPAAWTPQ